MRQLGSTALRAGFALLFVALAAPSAAAAEDNGFKVGEGRLHPFLDIEGRYDTNVKFSPSSASSEGDLILHFKPGFELNVPGQAATVDLKAEGDWAQYTGIQDSSLRDLSHLFGDATLSLGVNRSGAVGLELSDSFRRSDRSPSLSIGSAVVSNFNDLGLKIPIRPGGGALIIGVGGDWQLETFEPFIAGAPALCPDASCDPGKVSSFAYNNFTAGLDARWKFLPRTALVLDANYLFHIPFNPNVSVSVSGLKTMAGLAGLVSTHVATTIKAGYGDTFGSAGVSYRTYLANAEIEYLTQGVAGVRAGYIHTWAADPGTALALYGIHRAYLDARVFLAGRLTIHALAGADYLSYVLSSGSTVLLHVEPSADFEVAKWIYISAGYAFTSRGADFNSSSPSYNFTKNEAWLKIHLIY
jgi:hypothetical protein